MIFNRFAAKARRCVEAALEEARRLGHDSIGDEDLLLGILRADEGYSAEALSSLGVTLERAREESEGMFSDALSSIGISLEEIRREAGDAFDMRIPDNRRIPFSPQAKARSTGSSAIISRSKSGPSRPAGSTPSPRRTSRPTRGRRRTSTGARTRCSTS